VVAVLSGGNIDPLLMLRVLRYGLVAAGRFLSVTVRVPDRPGNLAGLLSTLARFDANVLDVGHARISGSLGLHEVDIAIELETRGEPHADEVLARLAEEGYAVTRLR
jgi:threonine dehydratase